MHICVSTCHVRLFVYMGVGTSFIQASNKLMLLRFLCIIYPRPVLAIGYCRCLRLCVCVRVCVCQSWACPHDNSQLVQARITKFGTKVQKTLVRVPIVLGVDRSWPSRSNLNWKSNFTSFWVCLPHNSSAVQARITNIGPKMHLSTVKIPMNFGLDWNWSSPSFSVLKPIFLPIYLRSFCIMFSETHRF